MRFIIQSTDGQDYVIEISPVSKGAVEAIKAAPKTQPTKPIKISKKTKPRKT